ncbi:MAG: pyridoxamine 5'-phosphate oxidase family protein [Rhodovibrionaceae bacterium]
MAEDKTYASDIAFSAAVKAEQEKRGSRGLYAKMAERRDWETKVTNDLTEFLAQRDSFYLATANAEGQPYLQHRGGPKGFLKKIDDRTLGFADFGGNRQYITLGNLAENDWVQLFLMDYPNRRRVKIWGRARLVEDDPALLTRFDPPPGGAVERAILISVAAWDVNCESHILPRFTEEDLAPAIGKLHARIAELEAELARLK